MARLFFILILAQIVGLNIACAQNWSNGSITGEGEVVKKEISLESFDGIGLSFDGSVILTQGSAQKVVIEAQQNIIDNIKTDVRAGSWNIGFKKNVKSAKDITIYITMPVVKDLALSGSGSIRSTSKFKNLADVDIAISGSGAIKFEFEGKHTDVALSGSGGVELAGTATELEIAISGSGNVTASELVTSKCDVAISGSGDSSVHVNGDLEAAIVGSGDVHYKGDANVKASVMGSGTVKKL
jgi:hypothetical protein